MQESGQPSTMIERYIWSVTLRDGTVINEYDLDGTHHSFTEVSIDEVVQLVVSPNAWLGWTGPTYVVGCDPDRGLRPIVFRTVMMNAMTGETLRWHVFGTQRTVNGENVKSLVYISNDDESGTEAPVVVLTDRPLDIG